MIKKERFEESNFVRKGFTLIEILIVVAIIAILASIVLVGLGPTQQSGRDARRLSDLHEIQNGLELYYSKCGYYPGGVEATTPCGAFVAANSYNNTGNTVVEALDGSSIGITVLPDDPTSGKHYFYEVDAAGDSYVLGATLENANNSVFDSYTPPSVTGYTGDAGLTCLVANKQYCLTL